MSTFPTSPSVLIAFNPLKDRLAKAWEAVEDAARKAADAKAAAQAAPDDAALRLKAEGEQVMLEMAQEEHDAAARLVENSPRQPVYNLLAPSYRSSGAFAELLASQVSYPSDRSLFRAAAESGIIPDDDPDLEAVREGLKTSPGGVPGDLLGVFNDLVDRASHAPAVRAIVGKRVRFQTDVPLVKVKFYLKGVTGLLGFDGLPVIFETGPDGLASDATIDAIPPEHIQAIGAKIDELSTLKGREKNSCGSPSPSPASLNDIGFPTTTETPTAP